MKMRVIHMVFLCFLVGCSSESTKPIEATVLPVVLFSPTNGDSCTTAIHVNENESKVNFQWSFALNASKYTITVQNDITKVRNVVSMTRTSVLLQLQRGAPYRWWVVSSTEDDESSAKSAIWQFYLEGSEQLEHVPNVPKLINPSQNQIVSLNESKRYLFTWIGGDLDGDLSHYNLYVNNRSEGIKQKISDIISDKYEVTLKARSSYRWKVESVDEKGNTSMSLTQSFTTN